jgi:hypothetical protein
MRRAARWRAPLGLLAACRTGACRARGVCRATGAWRRACGAARAGAGFWIDGAAAAAELGAPAAVLGAGAAGAGAAEVWLAGLLWAGAPDAGGCGA